MSISPSSVDRQQARIQTSEALKVILRQKRKIHRLFEKNLPKIIAKSKKSINKSARPNSNDHSQNMFAQGSPSSICNRRKPSIDYSQNDFTNLIQNSMYKTAEKLSHNAKFIKLSPKIRERNATPDIWVKGLQTVVKFSAKGNYKRLKKSKISILV